MKIKAHRSRQLASEAIGLLCIHILRDENTIASLPKGEWRCAQSVNGIVNNNRAAVLRVAIRASNDQIIHDEIMC